MWKRIFFIVIALSICWQIFGQKSDQEQYIDRYKKIAIKEMKRSGVPASIKLAQGLLESNSGKSTLARRANNHFGMKCGSAWKGKTYYKEDDDYDANGKLIKSCFRAYRNAEASYIAHSEFLRDPNKNYRYGFLFRLDPADYKAWARGLKKAGYATSPTYAQNLINTVERYKLDRYDTMTLEDIRKENKNNKYEEDPVAVESGSTINGVKVAIANRDETPADISLRTGVSVSRILKYNEDLTGAYQSLRNNQRVFLQRKRSSYRGKKKYHQVRKGESMFAIAQQYGIRLSKLYKKNRMEENTQPAEGEKIKIRGWKVKAAPRLETDAPVDNTDVDFEWETGQPDNNDEDGFEISFPDTEKPTNTAEDEVDPEDQLFHTVVAGDTLFGLARKYQTSVEKIKSINNLNTNILSIGQRLRVR